MNNIRISPINNSYPQPIYQQIIEWMQEQITTGNWPEHFRLPSEVDLANQLEVSRGTLRKAITQLISDGRLISIHGRGTFVASKTIEQPLAESLITFSEAFIEKKIPFSTRVINKKEIPAPPKIASMLSISDKSPVFFLERIRSVGQSPLIYLINYINVSLCPDICSVNFEEHRLFEILEDQYQLELSWGQRTFEAQAADRHVSELLGIRPYDPVMFMEQDLYLQNGSAIEVSNAWIKGSNFRLSAIVKRGERRGSRNNTWDFVFH